MNELAKLVEKLNNLEPEIANEKGPFTLFALFEREDLFDLWDLVVSVSWAKKRDIPTLKYIADALRRHLSRADMTRLARIVVLQPTDNPVLAITEKYPVEHGPTDFIDLSRFNLPVTGGYIITSRRAVVAA